MSERKAGDYACVQQATGLKITAERAQVATLETVTRLLDRIRELEVERDLLIKWFKWTMWTEGDWSGSIDGADLQDQAEKMGLIKMVTQEKPCRDDGCMCAEVYGTDEFPVECFVYADWLKEESEDETIHTYDPDSHDSTVQRHGTG